MNEGKTLCLVLGAAIVVLLAVIDARAQETATYQQIIAAQERWQGAITTPSPWDSAKSEKAAHEAPRPRQTAIQKIIEESSRCVVDWHSQRPSRPSRITCYAAR